MEDLREQATLCVEEEEEQCLLWDGEVKSTATPPQSIGPHYRVPFVFHTLSSCMDCASSAGQGGRPSSNLCTTARRSFHDDVLQSGH